jgi:hypothetical protein
VCYKCREKGHFADACPSTTIGGGTDRDLSDQCKPPVRPVLVRPATLQVYKSKVTSYPRTRLRSKHGQEIARSGVTNKNKSRICYECRQKGHMGKDCPNGNIPKSNLVHYYFRKLRNDKNGTCAMREISSPQSSVRAIWVLSTLCLTP